MKTVFLLLLSTLISSCSINFYKGSVGLATKSDKLQAQVDGENAGQICFKEGEGTSSEKCGNGGVKEYQGIGTPTVWAELRPVYLGKSNFGITHFLAYTSLDANIVDYPLDGEEARYEMQRLAVNPVLFYNFGKKYMRGSGWQIRLGLGASFNYLYKFKITRLSSGEEYTVDNKFPIGQSMFIEANWEWFTLLIENSMINFNTEKFDGVENGSVQASTQSLIFAYSVYL